MMRISQMQLTPQAIDGKLGYFLFASV